MPDIEAANPAREIEESVAINVLDHSSFRLGCKNRRGMIKPARNCGLSPQHQCPRTRPGNLSANLDYESCLIPSDRRLVEIDENVLGLEIFVNPRRPQFTAIARLFEPPHGPST